MSELDAFEKLMNRHQSMSPTMRDALMQNLKEGAVKVGDEMMALEDRMSAKRDWLDTHTTDPRYPERKQKYMDTEVRLHARYEEVLERYGEVVATRAYGHSETGTTTDDTARRPLADHLREEPSRRRDGRADTPDAGVAIPEPERPAPRQAEFSNLAARLRAERTR